MKKILFVLVLGFSAAAAQASTCETRVDAHQGATTLQRVDYCLNEPKPEEVVPAQVIYYGVVSTEEEAEGKQAKDTAKDGYYDGSKIAVSRGYLGTQNFPAFTNDKLSESERAYQRKHMEQARAEANEKIQQAVAEQKAAPARAAGLLPAQEEQPVQVVTAVTEETQLAAASETKAGVSRRQKKPARTWKQGTEILLDSDLVTEQPVYIPQPEPVPASYESPVAGPEPTPVQPAPAAAQPAPEYNPYYESGVAISAPVTYDQISKN